jgi:plastocyanin
MTMRQRKRLAGLTSLAAVGLIVLVAGAVLARSIVPTVRIELVAEQMTFRAVRGSNPDDRAENPTLRLEAGQTVEIVLRSLDRGMKHDLVIPELDLQSECVSFGETTRLRFTAPSPGIYAYYCSMHPTIMRGQLVILE